MSEYINNGFKVGPNYQKPAAPLTKKWIDEQDPHVHQGDPNTAAWWDVFDDPILTGLLERSYARNLTLRAAAFQVLQAREQRAIALGEILPQSQAYALNYVRAMASGNQGAAVGVNGTSGSGLAPAATLTGIPSTRVRRRLPASRPAPGETRPPPVRTPPSVRALAAAAPPGFERPVRAGF